MPDSVTQFAGQFRDAVIARARGLVGTDGADEAAFREEAFTELYIDALAETGAVSEGHVCHFERRIGHSMARVDGYYYDEEEDDRSTCSRASSSAARSPPRCPGTTWFARSRAPYTSSRQPPLASTLGWNLLMRHTAWFSAFTSSAGRFTSCACVVLTDGLAKEFKGSKAIRPKGKNLAVHVWDIERLSRCVASGGAKEPIEVDFVRDFGKPIPCLPVKVEGARYESYLAVIPGPVLHRLYDDYGERLLELNVRSFLQARGKINTKIRKTILEEPKQFFAYNNGLTAIAEEVRTKKLDSGGVGIAWVRGLQIVNGGQTTASIHRAGKKDHAEEQIASIQVQAKLSVIDADIIEEMVPRISLYANSQNKVNEADFSANDPFHQQLERLSRSMWTPDGQTHWFYERARGQYQVARAREGRTPASQKKFDAINPSSQMFSKTDLATFEHCWEELPHIVSRGSQKNFREFTIRLAQRKPPTVPDENYFRQLAGKAILFRHVQTAARKAQIGAYRANVVAYTVAYLAHRAGSAIDLRQIWERQSVPSSLDQAVQALLGPVGTVIIQGAGTRNVTEYCKKEECWELVRSQDFNLGGDIRALAKPRHGRITGGPRKIAEALRIASELGVRVVDNTHAGGPLWLIADQDRTDLVKRLEEVGLTPRFAPGGGRATDGHPAWFVGID